MKQTFAISAFPACGKSYCFNNHQDKFSMLDSDSSEKNSYLDLHFLYLCFDNSMGNLTCLWAND
ncbi:TPA: hypothetical protein N2D99_002451 [Clostridium botulinum]|nr:hypothetical protein [Clostridium botulinum]